jgi:small conductance mechanosensitive channel
MFENLTVEELQGYLELAQPYVEGFLLAIFILILGWWGSKWAVRLVHRAAKDKLDAAVTGFLSSIAQYSVLAAAVIAALGRVGVETTSLIAIFASAGLAVGLALQGSLSSFASGVMILIFKPFRLGDVVTAGGHTGGVEDIGLFATTFHTPDNQKIIIPNAAIIGGSIVNLTSLGTRRLFVDVGVAYGTDLNLLRKVCLEATASVDMVLPEPGLDLIFVEMAASSINFKMAYWVKSEHIVPSGPAVRTAVYNALCEAGIEIPYDQVVLHQAEAG